mmetsp:Transcript_36269/g.117273  ORF Transcript_36269/g.117273 Transcript_36269/m.117273 type:complete len:411 (-) Transcript_36269:56-1288(-)
MEPRHLIDGFRDSGAGHDPVVLASTGSGVENPDDHSMIAVGFGLAILSAVFNGTFGVFGKLCAKAPDPVIFNTFLTYGTLLSSMLVLLLSPLWEGGEFHLGFTWFGALAGALFVFATLFSFIAIPLAGLATSSATWSCSAVLIAFLWGAVAPVSPPRQPMKDAGLSVVGVCIMVVGVLVINFSARIGRLLSPPPGDKVPPMSAPAAPKRDDSIELSTTDSVVEESSSQTDGPEPNCDNSSGSSADSPVAGGGFSVSGQAAGLLSAVSVGFFGGSVLVPAGYVPERLHGLRLIPSFGIGAACVGTAVGALYWLIWRPDLRKEIRPEVVRNAMCAGVVWNLGNICQVIAQGHFKLSYGIAYPILQCALLFSGLWGIYFFREVTHGPTIFAFWAGASVLIAGVVLLGLFGPGA